MFSGRLIGVKLRIAVKVLNLQQRGAFKSFTTECDVLRNTVHPNIIKILTTCSGIDSMGRDFKAIIFEFMANGSLDNWLHTKANEQSNLEIFNIIRRINIAINVASALYYLHHSCEKPIIHCDIKPSNILLDDSMAAHVSDFGLAKHQVETLIRSSMHTFTTYGFMGTIGYVAPEYGTANKVSTKGDVYSYGMLLLEMFTGKRPTDDIFGEDMSIRNYVEINFPENVLNIVDARLLSWEVNGPDDAEKVLGCISSLLRIGLSCSSELPACRPEMRDVIQNLRDIRDLFLKQKQSPVAGLRRAMNC